MRVRIGWSCTDGKTPGNRPADLMSLPDLVHCAFALHPGEFRVINLGPRVARLEQDHRLEHADGSGIERRLDAAQLADDQFDLRDPGKLDVLFPHHVHDGVDRTRREDAGHVEEVPLVQRRHEFLADPRAIKR